MCIILVGESSFTQLIMSENADIEVNNLSDILNFLWETSYEICKEIKKR